MIKGETFDFPIPEQINLGAYLLDGNLDAGRGDKTAIHHKDGSLTFLELWELTNQLGNILRELGVEPENRVLLVLEDSPQWVAAWIATMKIGGVGTHAYTYLPVDDYAYLLNLVRPKVVVADKTTLERMRDAMDGERNPKALLVAGEDLGELRDREFSLTEMLGGAEKALEIEPTHGDDLAFWNFSGGTTGKPKGVPHTHRDGYVSHTSFDSFLSFREDDIVLKVPKLFFHYARDLGAMFPLQAGATVVLFGERTTTELTFELIDKYRPTVLINVPTMMRSMIRTPKLERADLSCIRTAYSSGELLSAQLYHEWFETFGCEVINRFGSAESAVAYLGNRPGAVLPGSSGTVSPLTEVKLMDDGGKEVKRGEPGVLWTRSDCSGLYYVREHEKSKETFLGDEWVNTGDVFTQDEDDYFWYAGRADDMIKVSGVWISPLEIERGMQVHDEIKEVVAMGLRDGDGLIKLKAFVAMSEETEITAVAAEELKRFCKETMAPHKFPSVIEFMDELPKTGQGKIDRRTLRDRKL